MGLMLSVLVFCVGVAEMLDCWHHFFLFLVQPQHNPLPYHLDPKVDVLSERELTNTFESARPSRVDICWPKDLSPTDDLHVIKKRAHNESERKHDQDKETRGVVSRDQHWDESQGPTVKSLTPTIEIHCIEDDGSEISPIPSRENSPGLLELDVIVESDSSSEFDEPSQIENLAYVMKINENLKSSVGSDVCVDGTSDKPSMQGLSNEETPFSISIINEPQEVSVRQTSQVTPSIDDTIERETQIVNIQEENNLPSDKSCFLKNLPTSTDNDSIDSSKMTPCHSEKENQRSLDSEQLSELPQTKQCVSEDTSESSDAFFSSSETRYESCSQDTDQPGSVHTDSCDSNDVFPITEVPEVTLHESSPVPLDDSTDSSLNTSDASWMVKSRTSDRPLVIRFNPEDVANEFMSVTKIDLQAFDDKHKTVEASKPDAKESYNVISDCQESRDSSSGKGTGSRERPLQTPQVEHDIREPNGLEGSSGIKSDNFGEDHKTSTQLETNSSSSSLSGIPQLPEDVRDIQSITSLPSDNGYGNSSLQTQVDYLKASDSGSDYLVQTSSDGLELDVVCELESNQPEKDSRSEICDTNNIPQTTEPSTYLETPDTKNKQSDFVQTENVENVCAQPLTVPSQKIAVREDTSNFSLENRSNPPLLEISSSKESPLVGTKSNELLQTDELPTSKSIAQSAESCSLLPSDERTTQPPVSSENPDQESFDKTQRELDTTNSDADFKPKPLQRRDTKRKSKITPRTYSRENSSKSDEAEVLCPPTSEPSETNSAQCSEVTSDSLRTNPPISAKEDLANTPSLDKPEPSSLSTGGSPNLPSKDEREDKEGSCTLR